MSQSSVTVITEDHLGYMWMGTPNGLNKYNGRNFEIFKHNIQDSLGLSNGYIESIYEDHTHTLWIGTIKGLNVYNRVTNKVERFITKNGKTSDFLKTLYIRKVYRTGNKLWLGTAQNGVLQLDLESELIDSYRIDQVDSIGLNNNFVADIIPIDDRNVLAFMQGGIYLIDPQSNTISSLNNEYRNISSAYQSKNGTIWVGTFDGMLLNLQYKDQSVSIESIPLAPGYTILSLAEDVNGDIWIGTENQGLFILNTINASVEQLKHAETDPTSIANNSIWSLYYSSNSVMWVGTFSQGISFYDPEYFKFNHVYSSPFNKEGLSHNLVNCFLEDQKGNLWIGTDGGGLNYWDRTTNTFKHFNQSSKYPLSSNAILSLIEDAQGNIWAGTWAGGINVIDPKTEKVEQLSSRNSFISSDNVFALVKDQQGKIWAGSFLGTVDCYDPSTDSSKSFDLVTEDDSTKRIINISSLIEDSDGNIWVGTQTGGVFKINKLGNFDYKVKHYPQKEGSVNSDFIYTIYEDKHNEIWIGTQNGLNHYLTDTDSFEYFNAEKGLIDNSIKGILQEESGVFWLSSNKGLMKFNPKTMSIASFDVFDGLQSNEFIAGSTYFTAAGEFIFGGTNGFNIFQTDQIKINKEIPKVYFSALRIFNQPVNAGDDFGVLKKDISQSTEVVFSHKHSVISFDFIALNYRHPEKIQYAYYLDGFEDNWNYVGKNYTANYTNLSPGSYQLKVKASNNDGIWNEAGISLDIDITPPFWATWWFRGLLIISILGSVILAYRLRLRSIKARQVFLESEIMLRTQALEEQKDKLTDTANKLKEANDEVIQINEEMQSFTFAVSHDLKSPLTTITGFIGLIEADIKEGDLEKIPTYISYIQTASQSMRNLIADIVEMAKLGKIENQMEPLDTLDVIKTASVLVKGKLAQRNAELDVQQDLPKIFGDKNRVLQVFENLIDNAIKYMGDQPNPKIAIGLKETDEQNNTFFVRDNGAGIEQSQHSKIFQPFERLDRSIEGTGLGLPMVQKVVESHGGRIWVESDGPGTGSVFYFTLPKAS